MEQYVKSIKSHLDEALSQINELIRAVLALQEQGKQAEPASAEYEKMRDAIAAASSEYADVSKRLAEARAAYKDLKDYISKH